MSKSWESVLVNFLSDEDTLTGYLEISSKYGFGEFKPYIRPKLKKYLASKLNENLNSNDREDKIIPTDSNITKDVYSVYSTEGDMTFIMEDIIDNINGNVISTEAKGFYYGRPSDKDDQYFYGKLKATY